jgi:hypothetical protein
MFKRFGGFCRFGAKVLCCEHLMLPVAEPIFRSTTLLPLFVGCNALYRDDQT